VGQLAQLGGTVFVLGFLEGFVYLSSSARKKWLIPSLKLNQILTSFLLMEAGS
jgi:hypothetical protein